VRIVQGPSSPLLIPYIAELGGLEMLDARLQAEKALGPSFMRRVLSRVLEDVASRLGGDSLVEAGKLVLPVKPPPIMVASEVYVDRSYRGSPTVEAEVGVRLRSGSGIVVLGSSRPEGDDLLPRALERVMDVLEAPVGVDPFDPSRLKDLAGLGVDLVMSIAFDPSNPPRLDWMSSRQAVVLIPPRPTGALEAGRWIIEACRESLNMGLKAIVDPVMMRPGAPRPPVDAIVSARTASLGGAECPIMVGINNFYEMIDADTQGSIAALVELSGEAGVSLVLVGEESWKARGATLEARIASYLATASLATGAPPKDWGVDLLYYKGKREGEGCEGAGGLVELPGYSELPESFTRLLRKDTRDSR
jgi:hypothetical protein